MKVSYGANMLRVEGSEIKYIEEFKEIHQRLNSVRYQLGVYN
jgi:hypothetical protein